MLTAYLNTGKAAIAEKAHLLSMTCDIDDPLPHKCLKSYDGGAVLQGTEILNYWAQLQSLLLKFLYQTDITNLITPWLIGYVQFDRCIEYCAAYIVILLYLFSMK